MTVTLRRSRKLPDRRPPPASRRARGSALRGGSRFADTLCEHSALARARATDSASGSPAHARVEFRCRPCQRLCRRRPAFWPRRPDVFRRDFPSQRRPVGAPHAPGAAHHPAARRHPLPGQRRNRHRRLPQSQHARFRARRPQPLRRIRGLPGGLGRDPGTKVIFRRESPAKLLNSNQWRKNKKKSNPRLRWAPGRRRWLWAGSSRAAATCYSSAPGAACCCWSPSPPCSSAA